MLMADAKKSQPNLHQASVYTTHNANGSNLITHQQNQHGALVPASNVSNSTADSLPTNDPNDVNGAENNVSEAKNSSSSSNNEQVMIDKETEEYFKSFPPGYRFCPSDTELIVHYLNKKIKNNKLPRHRIQEVNLYKYSPDKVSEMYQVLGEKEWYFFTPRDRKYSNGTRPNRAAGSGYWKATGADKAIRSNGSTIGFRKALVFYEGKPPKGDKTNWIMHEYRVNAQPRKKSCATDMRLDDYVLCRIYKKTDKSYKSRQRNGDEQNDHLYLNSPIDQNVQAGSDTQYEKDEHMDDYRDYPQPVLPNGALEIPNLQSEVAEIPHLQCEVPDLSSTEDIANYNGNFLQSFDYGLGQTPACFLPMPSIYPTASTWDLKPKVMPMPPVYSTTNNVVRTDYLKEGAWDFKPKGLQQEHIWDKTQKDFLPPDFDIHNISFVDPEVNLDNILNNNPPSSPSDSLSMPNKEKD